SDVVRSSFPLIDGGKKIAISIGSYVHVLAGTEARYVFESPATAALRARLGLAKPAATADRFEAGRPEGPAARSPAVPPKLGAIAADLSLGGFKGTDQS